MWSFHSNNKKDGIRVSRMIKEEVVEEYKVKHDDVKIAGCIYVPKWVIDLLRNYEGKSLQDGHSYSF